MIKRLLLLLIRFYRRFISPMHAPCCPFTPTCSTYAMQAVEQHGALYGGYLATKHLLEHGYDKIAFLSVLHYQTSTARYYGYQAALWEKGLEVDPDKVVQIQDYSNVSIGYNAMKAETGKQN